MPAKEPAEGFGSVIPHKVLARLHQAGAPELRGDTKLHNALKDVKFPAILASGGLFQGTLYFVSVQFTIQNQGNAVISVSAVMPLLLASTLSILAGRTSSAKRAPRRLIRKRSPWRE